MGYNTELKMNKIGLKNVKFMGIYKNEFITLDSRGILPSITKMMSIPFKGTSDRDANQIDKIVPESDKNNFRYFWRFAAENDTYLIPIDHKEFEHSTIDK